MPEQVSTPPFSTLATRPCAAGVSRNFANKSLVAVFANAGAKPGKDRLDGGGSQVGGKDRISKGSTEMPPLIGLRRQDGCIVLVVEGVEG